MSSDININDNDHDSNYESDDHYRPPRARSPSIEIDWPPLPTGCSLCPFTNFRNAQALRQHQTAKVHRRCDQCDKPLLLGEAYYCATPEDGIERKKYFRGVPNRHVGCKPVHPDWGRQTIYRAATKSLMPASFTLNGLTCWVCQQICVSQLALHGHFERTGHGLCPHYVAKRRRNEEEDDEEVLGSWPNLSQRKRKRDPLSPSPPFRQRPPRQPDENRHSSTDDDCPDEISYFDSWFHLDAHLRDEHQNSPTNLGIPVNWERPELPSQDWAKQIAADKSIKPLRRRGNSYSPALPIQHLTELRQLCYGNGETQGVVYPFVHRFWEPSLVEEGFEPTPLFRKPYRPSFIFEDWVAPVTRKVVVLSTLTVSTGYSRRFYEDQPVHVTLIDFYTGETLISKHIEPPTDSVYDWREEETGLNAKMIQRAANSGYYSSCFGDRFRARGAIWDYINEDTIIVGYDLKKQLGALRMAHALVLDLKLVVADWLGIQETKEKLHGHGRDGRASGATVNIELENLTKCLLGLKIRGANKWKKTFRDTLEEALAIRETVMWCLENQDLVKAWGMAEKHGYFNHLR